MSLTIAPMQDHVLLTTAEPFSASELASPEVQQNLKAMTELFQSLPAVGLAAPQVGWSKRAFVMAVDPQKSRRNREPFPLTMMINPSYEVIDDAKNADFEGCFSVCHEEEGKYMMGQVNRFNSIHYRAWDLNGKPIEGILHDYHARVFQHECDHLDGVRYINRMANGNILYLEKDNKAYKVYLHQLPKVLKNNPVPELIDLIPIWREAAVCNLSNKLLQEIISFENNSR